MAYNYGMPKIISPAGLELTELNEEHGIVGVDLGKVHPEVGMCVEIIPSHGCTTVNLHDRYYVIQDDQLVDI